jgi:hypothetical protein
VVPLEDVDHQADAVDPPHTRGILAALPMELGTQLHEAVGCDRQRSPPERFPEWRSRMLASAPSTKEGEMTDYLLLYSGGKMPETEAEQADVMKAWDVWMTSIGPALKDGGNPFTPQAKTIDPMGKVTDGPAGSPASGYSIIQASSLDDAVKLAKDCPVLQGGAKISVYETFEVM